MRVTVIFDNFGPYHRARLRAAARVSELTAVEVAAGSAEYAWEREAEVRSQKSEAGGIAGGGAAFQHVTLRERGTSQEVSDGELVRKLAAALAAAQPDVVFVPGWSSRAAFAALDWCAQKKIPAVAMSESTEWDEARKPWKEFVKRKLVGLYASALVGGTPHRDYLLQLGMPGERVFLGYDAVDNGYFEEQAAEVRGQRSEVSSQTSDLRPPNSGYFLASARFIAKKNLSRLIEAYALYRAKAGMRKSEGRDQHSEVRSPTSNLQPPTSALWPLVLLGDGALRETLDSQLSTLNLRDHVHMPGFIQYPELPDYYARAGAFIHASTTEQWGLVVNEAMASGLPVLVSNRCGCARDLVQDGVNGYTFDPYDVEQIAQRMLKLSTLDSQLATMGAASQRIIADWGTERFAQGLKDAAEKAMGVGPVKATWLQSMILKAMLAG